MKSLSRNPVRPEPKYAEEGKEIFFPDWNCFCCEDTGLVRTNLARRVIPNFDSRDDKPPVCNCCTASAWIGSSNHAHAYDWRFDRDTCHELAETSRADWVATVKAKQQGEKFEVPDASSVGTSMRERSRTSEEEMEAKQKTEEVKSR